MVAAGEPRVVDSTRDDRAVRRGAERRSDRTAGASTARGRYGASVTRSGRRTATRVAAFALATSSVLFASCTGGDDGDAPGESGGGGGADASAGSGAGGTSGGAAGAGGLPDGGEDLDGSAGAQAGAPADGPSDGQGVVDGPDGGGSEDVDDGAPDACADVDSGSGDASIAAYCQGVIGMSCVSWQSPSECEASVHAWLDLQVSMCCGPLALELLRCGTQHGLSCSPTNGTALFDPACTAAEDAWQACAGVGDQCHWWLRPGWADGGSPPRCEIECDQYGASCATIPKPEQCSCTYGPSAGHTFTIPNCDAITTVGPEQCGTAEQ